MAEATAESPSTVLPNELMIEILSRVELRNPLQLWKSLIHDLQFMKKYLHRSHTEITVLLVKARQHYNAFRSHSFINNLVMLQEQEDGDADEEEEEVGGDEGEEEDEEEAAGGGDEAEEEEEGDEEENVDEEKDVEEEEKAVEEEEEAGAEKHWLMNVVAQLDDILVDVRLLKKDLETIKVLRLIEVLLLQEDNRRVVVRYIEGNFKTLRVNMEAVEDRVEWVKSFLQFCLKLATSSSSRI